ncbi:MAG: hypothetical protein IH593_02890, partial [Bacteroidales bacterium]|nr:hypothetical protein [Bacteroidales bacterium]
MNRRKFFMGTAAIGGTLAVLPSCIGGDKGKRAGEKSIEEQATDKVKHAMFSMQRASWEHGVASQAMLELGDTEMLYMMAREAVLRQQKDGRLAVVYSDNGVTDPGAAGEA